MNVAFPKGLVSHNEEFIEQLTMVDHSWSTYFFIYNKVYLPDVITMTKNMLFHILPDTQNWVIPFGFK